MDRATLSQSFAYDAGRELEAMIALFKAGAEPSDLKDVDITLMGAVTSMMAESCRGTL